MLTWLFIVELVGFLYCIGCAAERLGPVPDQIKEALVYFAFALGCIAVVLYSITQM